MIRDKLMLLLCLPLTAALGCAQSSYQQSYQATPTGPTKPSSIIIYPFAVDQKDITLNQGIFDRVYRQVSNSGDEQQSAKLAHEVASDVCSQLAVSLMQKGYHAVCRERGTPIAGENVLVVDGQFTDINEGNRLRRLAIGFGAGQSTLDTQVNVFQASGPTVQRVLSFNTHADSGKMPGAAVLGPAGVAAGGSAAVIVGTNAAMGGVKSYNSAMGTFADKTAAQIMDALTKYFTAQGWNAA